MKTALIKILIALFTFSIGIAAFLGWNVLFAIEPQIETINEPQNEPVNVSGLEMLPIQTSVCSLKDEPNGFDGKLISFQATTYVFPDGTVYLHSKDCYDYPHFGVGANLKLDSYVGVNSNLKTLLEGKNPRSRSAAKEVDVQITGTAKITFDTEGHKWYSITPTKIITISPVRRFVPKGSA